MHRQTIVKIAYKQSKVFIWANSHVSDNTIERVKFRQKLHIWIQKTYFTQTSYMTKTPLEDLGDVQPSHYVHLYCDERKLTTGYHYCAHNLFCLTSPQVMPLKWGDRLIVLTHSNTWDDGTMFGLLTFIQSLEPSEFLYKRGEGSMVLQYLSLNSVIP